MGIWRLETVRYTNLLLSTDLLLNGIDLLAERI
jgi:hypothetical protein